MSWKLIWGVKDSIHCSNIKVNSIFSCQLYIYSLSAINVSI